jgi:polyferredoxin
VTLQRGPVGAIERRMRMACYLALLALGLIAWSLVDPAPLPVIGAMTVGQAIGTASFAFFLFAVVADLRPALLRVQARAIKTAEDESAAPEAEPRSKGDRKGPT